MAELVDKLELSYIKSSNKTAATASNIRITTANTNYNKRGGLVGIIDNSFMQRMPVVLIHLQSERR